MKSFFHHNGLSIVLLVMFAGTMVGQIATGLVDHNHDQRQHGQPVIGLGEYLRSGHFWEATAENWESEWLQMAAFVILTSFLFQKGSPESKDPDKDVEPVDQDPELSRGAPNAPWPVRRGGWLLMLYSNSLSIAFVLLFLVSFVMHAVGGRWHFNQEQAEHGEQGLSLLKYMSGSRFWFESFQNWQSEFLSIFAMVVLTIYLRQRGSTESKPVASPHDDNGDDPPPVTHERSRKSGDSKELRPAAV